jgi:hypothetical protein
MAAVSIKACGCFTQGSARTGLPKRGAPKQADASGPNQVIREKETMNRSALAGAALAAAALALAGCAGSSSTVTAGGVSVATGSSEPAAAVCHYLPSSDVAATDSGHAPNHWSTGSTASQGTHYWSCVWSHWTGGSVGSGSQNGYGGIEISCGPGAAPNPVESGQSYLRQIKRGGTWIAVDIQMSRASVPASVLDQALSDGVTAARSRGCPT